MKNIKVYLFGDERRPTQTPTFWSPIGSSHLGAADTAFEISNAPWHADLWNAVAPGCRSLSVGDLVAVTLEGITRYFVCKGCGWGEVSAESLSQLLTDLEAAKDFSLRGQLVEKIL